MEKNKPLELNLAFLRHTKDFINNEYRYLNTAIRQISRHTVMDWINQAVTAEAQVLLKHTGLLVFQIADELHFPNPSFFCKFFKRMTGMTPQEYQKK